MTKKVRISLYIVSLVITTAVLVLLIFNEKMIRPAGSQNANEQTNGQVNTEVNENNQIENGTEEEDTVKKPGKEEDGRGETTTIIFAGDVMLASGMEQFYDTEGVAGLLSEELLEEMRNADICMVNNEFQFSTRGTPMEDKQFTFRTDPEHVQMLLDMGVDIVSLANNHTIDFGTEALQDTFTTLDDAGILYAGAGNSKERAEELQIIEVNGLKFGFLAATRVIPVSQWNVEYRQPGLFATYDDTRLVECIEEARAECDFLTVYVHWGVEREAYPQDYQTAIAKNCFEAGADLVIGAHPHVLQGIEFIDGKPVFYSLGNYIFAQTIARTALVKVEVQANGEATYSLIPAYAEDGQTKLFEGETGVELYDYMNEISPRAFIDEMGNIYDIE